MIKLIEAQNFRSLKSISCPVAPFNVLVGSNGSGKTTFLDVLQFISDLLNEKTIDDVFKKRNISQYEEITFACGGGDTQIAIEADIPNVLRQQIWDKEADTIRYELRFGLDANSISIKEERVVIFNSKPQKVLKKPELELFPQESEAHKIIGIPFVKRRAIVSRQPGKNTAYYSETADESGKGWKQSMSINSSRSSFAYMLPDEKEYPVTNWFFNLLQTGIQTFMLDSLGLRKASPPKYRDNFALDGSNLPWNVKKLKEKNPKQFKRWVNHVKTAIKGLEDVEPVLREDDLHSYLILSFSGGIKIPSWLASDGTLRLMAFTILAYLPDFQKTFLIEEPENGIHPAAMEVIFQSLADMQPSQVFMATHSPAILSLLEPEQILCFAKTENGATDIVRGDQHPQLKKWQKGVSTHLNLLHAGGVLG